MPVRHWGNDPNVVERGVWDELFLGGKRLPGLATVELKLPTGVHKRKGRGKRGAHLRDEGAEPRELRITLYVYDSNDPAIDDARDFVCGKANGDPSEPLEVRHEAANFFRVSAVVIGDVEVAHPDPVEGWVWQIQAFEWLPETAIPDVKDQKKKAQDDTAAWLPYRDDGVAGSTANPSDEGAHENLPEPRAP